MMAVVLLPGVEQIVRQLPIFGCRVWERVPNKTGKILDAKVMSRVDLQCIPCAKYRTMLDSIPTVEIIRPCLVRESKFSI